MSTKNRASRLPGWINAAGALAVVIATAALAARTATSSPPAIAEFAPLAQRPIQNAPSELGALGGSGTARPPAASPSPSPPGGGQVLPAGTPLLRCVGDPPRQIEDPQSPPCVPYWTGASNGGSTWRGVNASDIDVAVPNSTGGKQPQYYSDLQRFFNSRFEFYGRHLVFQQCCSSTSTPDPVKERADADQVYTQLGSFASVSYTPESGAEYFYYDELAHDHVISVRTWPTWATEAEMAAAAPYEWSVLGGGDDVGESGIGAFVCNQLKGGTADHAGPPFAGQPRVFGLLKTVLNGFGADDSRLRSVLQDCGITIAVTESYDTQNNPLGAQTAMVAFRQEHVTTVICLCEGYGVDTTGMTAASNQSYFPEWVVSSYMDMDISWAGHLAPAQEAQHFFGLSFFNKDLPADQQPVSWALKEVDPSWTWEPGSADQYRDPTSAQWYLYDDLLLLASGIQMAGPDLTPQAFQAGLFRTSFPNPGCGGPPYYQACVGFPDVHHMYQDAAAIWWDPTQSSYGSRFDQAGGAYCYAALGARHPAGTWPAERVPLFTGPCR